ncbi:MAG TPA: peptide chain release factor N(5)-glutamine methyltransferase [Frankiaceae bacterium]|nr:peptide chain release factor N(5)-glutamine methyltransferase [Frankiaceae bacterium]
MTGSGTTAEPKQPLPASVAIRTATARFAEADLPSPRPDAEQLAAHVLGIPRSELPLATFDVLLLETFSELVDRRVRREPLQHLVGTAGFRHLELMVGPGVFVPRPETEVVVEAALAFLRSLPEATAPTLVDLCTGSGTIAFSLAHEFPRATVHAVELDAGALEWTRRNADRLDLPVELHLGDAEHGLPEFDGRLDLVVSNPPYVAEHEVSDVDPEVRDHDPEVSLVAGPDGLDVVRAVEKAAWRLLRPGGMVIVEHSDRQGRSAPEVFASRWREVQDFQDLTGRDRYVTAVRP